MFCSGNEQEDQFMEEETTAATTNLSIVPTSPSKKKSRILMRMMSTPSPQKMNNNVEFDKAITFSEPLHDDKFVYDESEATLNWIAQTGTIREADQLLNDDGFLCGIWVLDAAKNVLMKYTSEVTILEYEQLVTPSKYPKDITPSQAPKKRPASAPPVSILKKKTAMAKPTPSTIKGIIEEMISEEKLTRFSTTRHCRGSRVYHNVESQLRKIGKFTDKAHKAARDEIMSHFD